MPPGHYYSPIPGEADLARYHRMWALGPPEHLPGIDLHEGILRANLEGMIREYHELPGFPPAETRGRRYYYDNPEHAYQDAVSTRYFVRQARPARIIEVGAGYSSAVMLDAIDDLGLETHCTFIEPDPDARLLRLLTKDDRRRHAVRVELVQDTPLEVFAELGEHDILFIDSSHVSKICSDVNWYLFEILPRLASGVLIHIHDINYPFEWPPHMVDRAWNEPYLLRAFLMYNTAFQIVGFNAYYSRMMTDRVREMPLSVERPGGSFWMRKR